MPPARKASTKKTRPASRPADRLRARHKENDRVIRRITDSLDVAMKDLPKIAGNVGAGVGDLRKDLAKLLRDARRHATKMSSATRKELERLQKDMASAAKSSPARSAGRKSRTATTVKKSRSATTRKSARATKGARKARGGAATRKAATTGTARKARPAATRKRASSAAR
jgi:hypothetical protein